MARSSLNKAKAEPIDLVRLFHVLGPAYLRWTSRHVPTQGMTPARMRVLAYLEEHGPSPMRALKDALQTTATNITGLVDALEGEGLVKRQDDPNDRRVTRIALTSKGKRERAGAWDAYEAAVARVFERLSPAERASLATGLTRLVEALEEATSAKTEET